MKTLRPGEVHVLVTGGREYYDLDLMMRCLRLVGATHVVHGGQRGADTCAEDAAKKLGLRYKPYPANWERFRQAAGPIRNAWMLRDARPDLVLAFPGHDGTADMVSKARIARVPVLMVLEWKTLPPLERELLRIYADRAELDRAVVALDDEPATNPPRA